MSMSTQHADLFAALAAPFDAREIKVRSQAGRDMQYITARTAMNRLDDVLGPENWWDDYVPSEKSVLCRLTIRLPDGQILTKADAGGYAGMADSGDDDKSGYSDAFKRAAVKFGVARYLYRDGVPHFAQGRVLHDRIQEGGGGNGAPHEGRREINATFAPGKPPDGNWSGQRPDHTQSDHTSGQQARPRSYGDRPPASGKALFAWVKQKETEIPGLNLLDSMNKWAADNDLGGRMVDWRGEDIPAALEAAKFFIDKAKGKGAAAV